MPLCMANNNDTYQVSSPDATIDLIVTPGDNLYVSVAVDGVTYARTSVGLDMRSLGVVGNNASVSNAVMSKATSSLSKANNPQFTRTSTR